MLQLSVTIGVHDEDAYYFQPRLFGKVLHEFHDFMEFLNEYYKMIVFSSTAKEMIVAVIFPLKSWNIFKTSVFRLPLK